MLSPKRLVCSYNFHMAHPVPSYPYVLVNTSLLCNCHFESGLTYVLKSLGFCSNKDRFTMYFSINSAFNHYMHKFGLSSQNESSTGLLTCEPVFDIFLNKSLSFRPQINDSVPIIPLNPPDVKYRTNYCLTRRRNMLKIDSFVVFTVLDVLDTYFNKPEFPVKLVIKTI